MMKSFKQFIAEVYNLIVKESKDSTVKGWIHPKRKKVYLTKRMRPYHVEFIVKKPKDFGVSGKDILNVLEKWNDSMDSPDPAKDAKSDLEKFKNGVMDTLPEIEYLAMEKGWYRVVGNMWASEITGIKINDKIVKDVLNIMENEGVIPYDAAGLKSLSANEYRMSRGLDRRILPKEIKHYGGDAILRALRGKKTGKQTDIGRTMAMFRTR
tara:strand:- start:7580 stop:8209 length:630 start_codon:yes stop_codon:yes gene_type:complete